MEENITLAMLGHRLRLAVIGGGPGSFIGAMHRTAARLDDQFEIVAAVLSSNAEKSKRAAEAIGISDDRAYGTTQDLITTEAARPDGAEVIAIMTPNDTHFEYCMAALDAGFDVICDKPLSNTLEEAQTIAQKVEDTGLVLALTHNYTGYPLVRQARAMVAEGQLGEIRLVQVEYVQGGNADENDPDPTGDVPWRYDPVRGGASLVMGDIGTHAHNLIRFITGLEVDQIAAEVGTIVPGRVVHDYASAMLRFKGGARGTFWVTQAAAGVENCLRVRVSGTKGSIEWMQENPNVLTFLPLNDPVQTFTRNGPGTLPLAERAARIVKGHPEGFHEGFANIYRDAAEAIAARRAGKTPNPLALYFPNAKDGAIGIQFVQAALASSEANGAWTPCEPEKE